MGRDIIGQILLGAVVLGACAFIILVLIVNGNKDDGD